MRSAIFPPIRVEPEVQAEAEAAASVGESLTIRIEKVVFGAAAWRRLQPEFDTYGT
jgi:hypothetical protein